MPSTNGLSIRDYMICWTPADWPRSEYVDTYGEMKLIRHPDKTGESSRYVMSEGACCFVVKKFKRLERQHYVLSIALGAIHNHKLDPTEVHRALWPLNEYRDALPPDTQCPQSGERYGKYAAQFDE